MRELKWVDFKALLDNTNSSFVYTDIGSFYLLSTASSKFEFKCEVVKNTSDGTDFENNYKVKGNTTLEEQININNFNSMSVDSFGRLRTSEIRNVFESTHVNNDQSEFWDTELTGNASSTHHPERAAIDLTVGTEAGNKVIRQTLNYFHYAAGQSLMIRFTTVLGAGEQNLTILNGYGDDNNGLFFTVKDGVFGILIRSNTSGTPVDEFIPQSSFNVDKVDGTGKSGITIDTTKTQIFQIDMQWLGVGAVTFSCHIDGNQILLHKYNQNANYKDKVYMRTPHLPVRYEIKTTGVTAQANTLQQICTQVANEGKSLVGDVVRAVDMDTSFVNIGSSDFTPVISFRISPQYARSLVAFISFNYVVTTNDDVLFRLMVDGVPQGGSWNNVDGLCEIRTPTSFSGGTKMGANYVSKTGRTDAGEFTSKFRLGSYIDGTPQNITVVAKCFSGSASVGCSILYKELF